MGPSAGAIGGPSCCTFHQMLQALFRAMYLQAEESEEGDEEEKEGVLHEEVFHRNPSLKLNHHERSRLQLAEAAAANVWHRLPFLQVGCSFLIHWTAVGACEQTYSA